MTMPGLTRHSYAECGCFIMNENELSKIYDSLSDQDKKIVGMIGISFIRGLSDCIKNGLRFSDVKKDN